MSRRAAVRPGCAPGRRPRCHPPDAAGSLAFPGRTRLEPPASFLAARRRCCQGHPQHSPGQARRSHRGRRCCCRNPRRPGRHPAAHLPRVPRGSAPARSPAWWRTQPRAAPSQPHGVRDRSPTPPAGTAAKRSAARPRRSPPRARPRPGNCPACRARRSIAGRPRPNAVLSSETRCRPGSRRSPGFWPSSPAAPPRGRPAAEPVRPKVTARRNAAATDARPPSAPGEAGLPSAPPTCARLAAAGRRSTAGTAPPDPCARDTAQEPRHTPRTALHCPRCSTEDPSLPLIQLESSIIPQHVGHASVSPQIL